MAEKKGSTKGKRAYVSNARDSAHAARGKTTRSETTASKRTPKKPAADDRNEQLKLHFEEDNSLRDEITVILILLVRILLSSAVA